MNNKFLVKLNNIKIHYKFIIFFSIVILFTLLTLIILLLQTKSLISSSLDISRVIYPYINKINKTAFMISEGNNNFQEIISSYKISNDKSIDSLWEKSLKSLDELIYDKNLDEKSINKIKETKFHLEEQIKLAKKIYEIKNLNQETFFEMINFSSEYEIVNNDLKEAEDLIKKQIDKQIKNMSKKYNIYVVFIVFASFLLFLYLYVLYLIIEKTISSRINYLTKSTIDFSNGISYYYPEDQYKDEIGILSDNFKIMIDKIVSSNNELKKEKENIELKVKEAVQESEESKLEVQDNLKKLLILNEKLEEAKLQADLANSAKSEFLANMSHEIRTPMNGVIGMTSLLLQTRLTEEQIDFVNTIKVSGDSLLNVINDILDFSKIESGKFDMEEQEFDFISCIESVIDLLSVKANEKKIDLLYSIDENVPSYIIGDITRLRQILVNLTNNAIKFTHHGEVCLYINCDKEDDSFVKIKFTVKDTGIGMSEKTLKKLFNSFTQADSSTARRYGGTGLGLVISKKLVEMMDGNIIANSKENQGSEFYFDIRVRFTNKSKVNYDLNKLKDKKALIVDDNETNIKILKKQLELWNMKTLISYSPIEAIEILKENSDLNIILTDMDMPDITGFEMSKEIRKIYDIKKLPIIILSSVNSEIKEYNDIINAYIMKPIKHSQLQKHLINIFSENKNDEKIIISEKIDVLSYKYPLKILIAEDNLINQKFISKLMDKLGYSIDIANNGNEAFIKCIQNNYDVVFMDMQMPEVDGVEATKLILNEDKIINKPKIIAMTANVMKEDIDKCLNAGMISHIGKPISLDKLKDIIITLSDKYINV